MVICRVAGGCRCGGDHVAQGAAGSEGTEGVAGDQYQLLVVPGDV